MQFIPNNNLITQSRNLLFNREGIYWVVGGSGSGKTTICQSLSEKYDIPVYDMDAHIYGAYHGKFTSQNHPVNKMWSESQNGLAWLLNMSWTEFNDFNQAALPEYLDLLTKDLVSKYPNDRVLIDGGICNPAIATKVFLPRQFVCLAMPERSSAEIWNESSARKSMKKHVFQLPEPEKSWQKFIEFDIYITKTILKECQDNNIPVCSRGKGESVEKYAERVAHVLEIQEKKIYP
ncbi:MAG: hypothetical protein IZT55_06265 [Anaerolineae bacterium]|nr:hypothetical protein [Anaerolineae bacterium]